MAGPVRKTMEWFGFGSPEVQHHDPLIEEESEPMAMRPIHDEEDFELESDNVMQFARGRSRIDLTSHDLMQVSMLKPTRYADAKVIGDKLREGIPVIMDVTAVTEAEGQRLVDFASGLVIGLEGTLQKVTKGVFLLLPHHVKVTTDDDRVSGRAGAGLFD